MIHAVVNKVVEFTQAIVGEFRRDITAIYRAITEMFASKNGVPPQIPHSPSLNVKQVSDSKIEISDFIIIKSETQRKKEIEIDQVLQGSDPDASSMKLMKIGSGLHAEAFHNTIEDTFKMAFEAILNSFRQKVPNEEIEAALGKFKEVFEQFLVDYAEAQNWSTESKVSLSEKNKTLRVELNKMLKVLDIIRQEESDDVRLYALTSLEGKLAEFEGKYTHQIW